VDKRVIQTEADKQALIVQISELKAEDKWTYLDVAMLTVFDQAFLWLKEHSNHNVDMRIYTDGANNGPDLTDQIREKMDLNKPDIPDNLKIYFLQYKHPDESKENLALMETAASRATDLKHVLSPFSTIFARVDWGRTNFGNMRAQGFEQPLTFVFYYDRAIDKKLVDIRADIESVTGPQPLINIQPRPVAMTTEALHESFKIENLDEIPEDATVEFSGKIRFVMQDTNLPVQFQPEAIPFTGRIAPLRKYTISLTSEGALLPASPVLKNGVLNVSLSDQSVIHTDRGVSKPTYFRVEIADSKDARPGDSLKLRVVPTAAANIDDRTGRFVQALDDEATGETTAVLSQSAKPIYLRVWYSASFLDSIRKPGYFPLDLTVEFYDPDLACDFIMPEAVTEFGEAIGVQRAKLVRFFPGRLPVKDEFEAYLANPEAWNPGSAQGGIISPPPGAAKKNLTILIMGLLIGAFLHFVCFVSRGVSLLAMLLFMLIAWIFGGWSGFLVLPMDGPGWIVWGFFAIFCIITILSPPCFALTPWGGKGWSMMGSSSPELWPRGRKIRKKSMLLWPLVGRIALRIGGGPGNDITEADFQGQKFVLISTPKKLNLFQSEKLKIQSRAQGMTINGEELGIGRTRPLKNGDKIFIEGRTYTLKRN
jgi:hypothetical protein